MSLKDNTTTNYIHFISLARILNSKILKCLSTKSIVLESLLSQHHHLRKKNVNFPILKNKDPSTKRILKTTK